MKEVKLEKWDEKYKEWDYSDGTYSAEQDRFPDEYYWLMLNLPIYNFYSWYRKAR